MTPYHNKTVTSTSRGDPGPAQLAWRLTLPVFHQPFLALALSTPFYIFTKHIQHRTLLTFIILFERPYLSSRSGLSSLSLLAVPYFPFFSSSAWFRGKKTQSYKSSSWITTCMWWTAHHQFQVWMYHKNLASSQQVKCLNPCQARWSLFHAHSNFVLPYWLGKMPNQTLSNGSGRGLQSPLSPLPASLPIPNGT